LINKGISQVVTPDGDQKKQNKMGAPKKPTTAMLLKAVEKYSGCTMDIARALKVDRTTIYRWRQKDKAFDEAMKAGNDILLDLALDGLKDLLKKKDPKVVMYTLDRLGRKQGFGMMVQVQDKSKLDDQLSNMTDEQILEAMESNLKRVKKG
jgi:DNA invertase Pin-like site-specific DNA recombinase